jgi:hypothetical protein
MKSIKIIVQIALFFLISINLFSQSRENRRNISFDKKSEKLTEATGWMLNKETGKWVDNKNVIYDRPCPSYWVSQVSQNFKWIQFATIFHKEKKYFVFLFERQSGSYEYPSIRQNWREHNETFFFVLDSIQYDSIKKVVHSKEQKNYYFKSKISNSITSRFQSLGGEHLYNEENLLAKITTTIQENQYFEDCFLVNSQNIDGENVVRFRLPESKSSSEYNKDAYFEVDFDEFIKLLSL